MSEGPAGNNKSSPRVIYASRESYDDLFEEEPTQMDLWHVNPFYGKVNEKGDPVLLDEFALKYISGPFSEEQHACIRPAADAFLQMKLHYSSLYKLGYVYQQSDFFTDALTDFKGWESARAKYEEYMQTLFDEFFDSKLKSVKDSDVVKNFKDLSVLLKSFLKDSHKPFTRKGFLASRFNPPSTTGFCIEVYNGNPADDEEKFNFTQDENFDLFNQLCVKYGFKIDRNVPWRIIADIQVEAMQNYLMGEFDVKLDPATDKPERDITPKEIFEKYYFVPDMGIYYEEFKTYLQSFYVSFKQTYPFYKKREYSVTKGCGQILDLNQKLPSVLTKNANREKFIPLSEIQYLKLFYEIRVGEIDVKVPAAIQRFHLKNVAMIYNFFKSNKSKAVNKAIEYIKYNLGTLAYRYEPLEEINLQRLDKQGIITSQKKFNASTDEDISYL